MCAKKLAPGAARAKNMQGDQPDSSPNAKPNGAEEARNKRNRKPWQDEDGFMHFPDGSMSSRPVD
ncbi:MAG: hypothetical protein EOP49_19575 [Sphingobacteriales bacterium]|nr:MAG: hypothetical protein EOP49_19575 [Sphingobacteriales bacterium]